MFQPLTTQPQSLKCLHLMLQTFDGDVVDGGFEELLAGEVVPGEDSSGEDHVGEVFAEGGEVEWDFCFCCGGGDVCYVEVCYASV